MTTRRSLPVLLLTGGLVLAQEKERPFSEEEIRRHLDAFDRSYGNRELPEADVASTLKNLEYAYRFLKAKGDGATKGDLRFEEEILDRVIKGLSVPGRPIVNIECARILGKLGDPKGVAPLVEWLGAELNQAAPNPQAAEYGFLSLAWIGPKDETKLEMVLSYAKGRHEAPDVATAAIKACAQWRELDGGARKQVFDGICSFLETLHEGDPTRRERYWAVLPAGLEALRELAGGTTRFESPAQARAWFAKNTKWEKYVGPRFRK